MTERVIELLEGEFLLTENQELVFRQITKHLIDDGLVSTSAFGPRTSDNQMPSYSRSSLVTAQESRDWHSENANSPSLGVWGVTVAETKSAGSYVVDDSQKPISLGERRAPGHCFIDFRNLSKAQRREIYAKLFFSAMARGEIFTISNNFNNELFEL